MKILILVLISLVLQISSNACCIDRSLTIFPSSTSITKNPIFLIEGFGASQNIISGLNSKHQIYIQNSNHSVKLIIKEINIGYQTKQALLVPESELFIGQDYRIFIDSLPSEEVLQNINGQIINLNYKVVDNKDAEKLVLTEEPNKIKEFEKEVVTKNDITSLSSTHDNFVMFNNPINANKEVLIKATVRNLVTQTESSFYLFDNNKKIIVIGQNSCGGSFDLRKAHAFEVEFSFLDSSGGKVDWKGERLKFLNPETDTNHRYKKY